MMLQLVVDDVRLHHKFDKHSVDIYIPEWNIAIEYQGKQHFQQHWRGDLLRYCNIINSAYCSLKSETTR
jgi:regulatory protein YycI of two-component signal transduction system YycFG